MLPKSEDEGGMSDAAPKAVCVVEEDTGADMGDVVEVKDEPVDDVEEVPVRADKSKKKAARKEAAAAKDDAVMVDEDATVKAASKKKKAGMKKTGGAAQKGAKKTGDKLFAGKKSVSSVDAARRKPRAALRK